MQPFQNSCSCLVLLTLVLALSIAPTHYCIQILELVPSFDPFLLLPVASALVVSGVLPRPNTHPFSDKLTAQPNKSPRFFDFAHQGLVLPKSSRLIRWYSVFCKTRATHWFVHRLPRRIHWPPRRVKFQRFLHQLGPFKRVEKLSPTRIG